MAKKRKNTKRKLGQTGVKHVPSMDADKIPKQMCKRAVYLLDSTLEDVRRGRTSFAHFKSHYEMVQRLNIPVQCVETGKTVKKLARGAKGKIPENYMYDKMKQIRCFCYPPKKKISRGRK